MDNAADDPEQMSRSLSHRTEAAMRAVRVDDCWGGRWTVRAGFERYADRESDYTRWLRAPALRGRLAPMLASQPTPPPVDSGPLGGTDRAADERRSRVTRPVGALAASLGSPLGAVFSVWQGVGWLREPRDRFWVVELAARGPHPPWRDVAGRRPGGGSARSRRRRGRRPRRPGARAPRRAAVGRRRRAADRVRRRALANQPSSRASSQAHRSATTSSRLVSLKTSCRASE